MKKRLTKDKIMGASTYILVTRRFSPVILHVSAFPGVPAAKTPCPRKLGMKAPSAAEGSCV